MAAPARRVGQNPQPQRDGRQGQEDVYQRKAQHHLHDHVEDEEAVDEVENCEQERHAHAARLHRGQKGAQGGAEHVSGGDVERYGYESFRHHTDYGQGRQNTCVVNVVRRSQASQQPAAPAQSWRASFVVRNSTAAEGARATRSGPSRWPPRRNACTPLRTARRPC